MIIVNTKLACISVVFSSRLLESKRLKNDIWYFVFRITKLTYKNRKAVEYSKLLRVNLYCIKKTNNLGLRSGIFVINAF